MNSFKKIVLLLLLIFVAGPMFSDIMAQCPMCRMSAESNLQHGGTEGLGLNKGILYLLSLPYLFATVIGFMWYKNNRKIKEAEQEAA